MEAQLKTLTKPATGGPLAAAGMHSAILRRKCACGSSTSSLTGECTDCQSKKRLQTKLTIGASNDPLEQEADRVAERVMARSAHSNVTDAPPRIHRFTGQATGDAASAPASVDQALASSGSPLEPALRQDMEQRFGHDFSRVRVHSGGVAEQSARDVNAYAYTVGSDIVFREGQFTPGSQEGQRLLAHELTHVVQQGTSTAIASGSMQRALQRKPKPPKFATGDVVVLELPALRMATALGGAKMAALLARGDRLEVEALEPQGGGEVFRVKVIDNADPKKNGAVGVVRVDWVKPAPAKSVATPAAPTTATGPSSTGKKATEPATAVDPLVPEGVMWADNFDEAFYDIEYRIDEGGSPSEWLRVRYEDGTVIDLNWHDFTRGKLSPDEFIEALKDRKIGQGGVLFPGKLTAQTTPRLWAAYEEMTNIGAQSTIDLMMLSLPAVMFVITIGMPVGPTAPGPSSAPLRATRRSVPRGNLPPRPVVAAHSQAKQAQQLATKIADEGDSVVVNIGGAGARHEPKNAINVNNQAVARKDIPNHVDADGADVGSLFRESSIDRVEGHRMAAGVVDWTRGAPGCYRVLKSGGTFRYSYQGATKDAAKLAAELEKAGFKDVANLGDVLVTATKP